MRILVVFSHPAPESFIGSLFHSACAALSERGHTLDIADLYADGFDPVLREDEFRAYASGRVCDDIARYVDQLRRAEGMLAIYPTWWYSMPAMMKGYFDRVWVPGAAFEIVDGKTAGLVANIRRLLVITTYGSSQTLIENEVGSLAEAYWMRGMRRLMAPDCISRWCAQFGLDTIDPAGLEQFRARALRELGLFDN